MGSDVCPFKRDFLTTKLSLPSLLCSSLKMGSLALYFAISAALPNTPAGDSHSSPSWSEWTTVIVNFDLAFFMFYSRTMMSVSAGQGLPDLRGLMVGSSMLSILTGDLVVSPNRERFLLLLPPNAEKLLSSSLKDLSLFLLIWGNFSSPSPSSSPAREDESEFVGYLSGEGLFKVLLEFFIYLLKARVFLSYSSFSKD